MLTRVLALCCLLASVATAADLRADSIECKSRKPNNDLRWWSFRLDVDGVRRERCWYPGRPGKPKNELHWGNRPGAVERSEDAVSSTPMSPRSVNHNDLANTCCWPPLESEPVTPSSTEPSFGQRWNNLLNDLAEPVTRWRGQMKDQHRFGE